MPKSMADSRSNRAAVQATNDDASASKLCVPSLFHFVICLLLFSCSFSLFVKLDIG